MTSQALKLNFKVNAPLLIEQLVDQKFAFDFNTIDTYQKDINALSYVHERSYITKTVKNNLLDRIYKEIICHVIEYENKGDKK